MKLFVLSTLLALAFSKGVDNYDYEVHQWEMFKIEHARTYRSAEHEQQRRKIFLDNARLINEHNAKFQRGEVTFEMAINKYADMTTKEFGQMMNGLRTPEGHKRTGKKFVIQDNLEVPKAVDWRKRGAVTPVKDQLLCMSCWAFSATGSLEGQNFKKTKTLTSLSEQNLIDCSKYGNEGCNGGYMDSAFKYVRDNHGIDTEAGYPYKAVDGKCRYNVSTKGASDSGFVDLPKGDEKALQQAVVKIGPISVGIDASRMSFKSYSGGLYKDPACSSKKLDHGVLVVGYGTTKDGADYWLVKNSWGTDWGMKGYALMARNHNNLCGIATMASYPTV